MKDRRFGRSAFEQYRDREQLKKFLLRGALIWVGYKIGRKYIDEHKDDLRSNLRKSAFQLDDLLNRGEEAIQDYKTAVIRGVKISLLRGDKTAEADPVIAAARAKSRTPFFRVKRSELPYLPEQELLYSPAERALNLPTLVLDADGVLGEVDYDSRFGWRLVKRPGADHLLWQLLPRYEVVFWSKQPFPITGTLVQQWGVPIMGCLHRDHCSNIYTPAGKHTSALVKDLNRLGRDLKRVVLVTDTKDTDSALAQPLNTVTVPRFESTKGDAGNDKTLIYLTEYLKDLASDPGDLRLRMTKLGRTPESLEAYAARIGAKDEGKSSWHRMLGDLLRPTRPAQHHIPLPVASRPPPENKSRKNKASWRALASGIVKR